MKGLLILLLSICLLTCSRKQDLSANQKFVLTAKVWGFLKYYHPEVNKGQKNWDKELIEITRKLPEINNTEELSRLYLDWIESLGEVTPVTGPDTMAASSYFDENFDLSWFKNEFFTQELSDRLRFIEQNRSRNQHFVGRGWVGQIEITNEPIYTASQWSDEDIRLIMLFRYWNVIEYFYPYKYIMDKKWDDILEGFIPKFTEVSTETEYHLAIHELSVSLGDSHSFFVTDSVRAFAGTKTIPAKFKIIDDKAIITELRDDSLSRLNDIQVGDAITMVNGFPVSEIYSQNEKFINGSNQSVKKLSYSFRWIFNGDTDTVDITYERNGVTSTRKVGRYEYRMFKTPSAEVVKWKKVRGTIGYVNMEEVLEEDLSPMMTELEDTKAVIFDFRNYPEFIIDEVLTYLNAEPQGFAKFIQPDLTYPGRFVWTPIVECGKGNPTPYKGSVIILVDESTQSRSEYFVMAMQTVKGAITIGRQTSGADGDVLDFTFFDDETGWITGRGVFYPDGRETQKIGIVPDIVVPISLGDIASGRDASLEKAIEIAAQ